MDDTTPNSHSEPTEPHEPTAAQACNRANPGTADDPYVMPAMVNLDKDERSVLSLLNTRHGHAMTAH